MRYFMCFSYDGSNFSGYQKQPKKRTIQEELENVLTQINGGKLVSVVSSGRTDAGVHALNQRAHFDLDKEIDCNKIRLGMNSLLPLDIYVKKIERVNDEFHARFSAIGKEYIYRINMGEFDPIERNYVFQYNKRLDISAMERALKYFEGTHNFKSFTKASDEITDYVRTISGTEIIRDLKDVNKIMISFIGTGFLRYMVRNIVGFLIEVGEGKRSPEEVRGIFEKEDRTEAGKTAPPNGLYLKNVFY